MNKVSHLFPLLIFFSLIILLFNFLDNEERQLQSVLIEKSFPNFFLPSLESQKMLDRNDLIKLPALVNIWATWCISCRVEHPFLMKLKEDSMITIYGINYKDERIKANKLLKQIGDPYEFSLFDKKGTLAIDLGVYGAPETFLVDRERVIKVKHVGVLTPEIWEKKFKKELESLEKDD